MYTVDIEFQNIIAVTNILLCKLSLIEQIEKICQCHPKAILLHEKDLSKKEYAVLAKKVINVCEKYHVHCILHTYINVAKEMQWKSIHMPLPLLRKYQNQLQHFDIVGTSVHSVDEAIEAERRGANYIIAGHIYNTDCKKGVPPRGISFLKEVCQNTILPVYGIGGIKLDEKQINEVINCGAKGVCIMSGMMKL